MLTGPALALGCGARSDLPSSESNGGIDGAGGDEGICAGTPSCADNTRGTYRLVLADDTPVGHLFFFDGSNACGGSATQYQLVLELSDENGRPCSRNSEIEVLTSTSDAFLAVATSHGGSFTPICGGDPWDEEVELELHRLPCEDSRYALSVRNSEAGSPFTLTATAVRCRCEIGWEPCVEPLPDDPCAL